jgi:hypothetical protein
LLYALTLHFFAGGMTGSTFKLRTLLLVLGFVLIEFTGLALVKGGPVLWSAAASLVAVQAGFVVGIVARAVLEYGGYMIPDIEKHRLF